MLSPWLRSCQQVAASVVPFLSPSVISPHFGGKSPLMTNHKRPHDMGGEPGGPIDTVDHGMKFWEKQANALRNTLTSRKLVRPDELRRAGEDPGDRHLQLGYFEPTTPAAP